MPDFAHRAAAGNLERQRRGVDVVIGAVGQRHGEVDDRKADLRSGRGDLANALLDRRDIFPRHVAALDLVDEDDALAALAGFDGDLDAAELAGAARLLLVRVVDVDLAGEALAVRHLQRADVCLDATLNQCREHDRELVLGVAAQDNLADLCIVLPGERDARARQLRQGG